VKSNFKMLVWILFLASIVLGLFANFFVQNAQTKWLLLSISFGMGAGGFLQMILYWINPRLFKNKPERKE
jgi:hypothetical protein